MQIRDIAALWGVRDPDDLRFWIDHAAPRVGLNMTAESDVPPIMWATLLDMGVGDVLFDEHMPPPPQDDEPIYPATQPVRHLRLVK